MAEKGCKENTAGNSEYDREYRAGWTQPRHTSADGKVSGRTLPRRRTKTETETESAKQEMEREGQCQPGVVTQVDTA